MSDEPKMTSEEEEELFRYFENSKSLSSSLSTGESGEEVGDILVSVEKILKQHKQKKNSNDVEATVINYEKSDNERTVDPKADLDEILNKKDDLDSLLLEDEGVYESEDIEVDENDLNETLLELDQQEEQHAFQEGSLESGGVLQMDLPKPVPSTKVQAEVDSSAPSEKWVDMKKRYYDLAVQEWSRTATPSYPIPDIDQLPHPRIFINRETGKVTGKEDASEYADRNHPMWGPFRDNPTPEYIHFCWGNNGKLDITKNLTRISGKGSVSSFPPTTRRKLKKLTDVQSLIRARLEKRLNEDFAQTESANRTVLYERALKKAVKMIHGSTMDLWVASKTNQKVTRDDTNNVDSNKWTDENIREMLSLESVTEAFSDHYKSPYDENDDGESDVDSYEGEEEDEVWGQSMLQNI